MAARAGNEADQALLPVVVAGGADAGHVAQCGLRAIGGDRQFRLELQAIVEPHAHAGLQWLDGVDPRRAMQAHAGRRQCIP